MSDAMKALISLSSGSVAVLARELGAYTSNRYTDLDRFHYDLLCAAIHIDNKKDFGRSWGTLAKEAWNSMTKREQPHLEIPELTTR